MGVSFKLALKYLRKNKKRSIGVIVAITIATILLISVFCIFNVYQNYMINLERNKENWETRYSNVSYEKLYGFEKNSDIKDISVIQNMGTSLVENENSYITQYIDLKAYDENAFKNLGIKLLEGHLPSKDNEIVVSKNFTKETNEININKRDYKIVGIIEPTIYDNINLDAMTISAITYLDKSKLQPDSIIDISVNFYNINDVYEISWEIADVLKLYGNDEGKTENIEFNTDLLHYYSIWDMNNAEDKQIITIMIFLVVLIVTVSVALIYSIFLISVKERKKEFAILNSIGATKEQIVKMILCEAGIILIVSILIAIAMTILLILGISSYINNMLSSVDINLANAYKNTVAEIPYIQLLLSILVITLVTFVATLIPAIKIKKISILEEMKGKNSIDRKINISNKNEKSIDKILTRRNKKLNPHRHRVIIFSFTLSIFLFLLTQGYLKNMNNIFRDGLTCNYTIRVPKEYSEEVKQGFIETNSVEKIYSYFNLKYFTQLDDKYINNSLKQAIVDCHSMGEELFYTSINNEMDCYIYALGDKDFGEYIKSIGLKDLKENECILVNYSNVKTDYYNGVYMTNYNEGDEIEIYAHSKGDGTFELDSIKDFSNIDDGDLVKYGDNQRKVKLKVAKIVNQLPNSIRTYSLTIPSLAIIVKEEALNNIQKYLIHAENSDTYVEEQIEIDIYSSNRELLDEVVERIKYENNLDDSDISEGLYIEADYDLEQIQVTRVFSYLLTILIFAITLINIINIIISDIDTRKHYFSILISIGMTKKQLTRMILKEYIKYFIISLLLGIILSLCITYIVYIQIFYHGLYSFKIPLPEIMGVIIIIVCIIMWIRYYVSQKIEKESINGLSKNLKL